MRDIAIAILPVFAVILGALITHRMNIHLRRRNMYEDVIHDAIAAVAEVQAAHSYIYTDGSHEERARRDNEAKDHYSAAVRKAHATMATASAFNPELARHLPPREKDPNVFAARGQEILFELRRLLTTQR